MRYKAIIFLMIFFSIGFIAANPYSFNLYETPDIINQTFINITNITIINGNLSQLQDVNIPSPSNENILAFNSASNNWTAQTFDFLNTIWQRIGNIISPKNSGDSLDMSGGNITADTGFYDFLGSMDNQITSIFTTTVEQVNHIQFNTSGDGCTDEACLQWNAEDGTLEVSMPGGEVNLQIGLEQLIRGTNTQGQDVGNCNSVRISGASGNFPDFKLSTNNNHSNALATVGLFTEDIIDNQKGFVNSFGFVRDCNTSAFDAGDPVFLGIDGSLTRFPPIAGGQNTTVFMGVILRSHETEGVIWNKPISIPFLEELSDVLATGKTNNSIVQYNLEKERWEMTINPTFNNITANNFIGGNGFFDNIYSRDEVDELVAASNIELFFKNTISGISTYWDMNRSSNGAPKNATSTTLSADITEVGGFISPNASELGIDGLDEGIIDAHFHANVDLVVGKKDVAGFFEVYIRHINNSETFLTQSHLVNVDTTVETEYEAHANLGEEIVLNKSDRIVLKMFANLTGSGGNPTLTVYIQGDTLARGIFATVGVNFATQRDLEDYLRNDGDTATGNYSFDSGTLFVDSDSDRVGIGTTIPTEKLDVNGSIRASNSVMGSLSTSAIFTHNDLIGEALSYALLQENDGDTFVNAKTGKTVAIRINNVPKMTVDLNGNVLFAENIIFPIGNSITAQADGNYALMVKDASNDFIFRTRALADRDFIWKDSSANEYMRLTSVDGKLGIGTPTPTHTLNVDGFINVTQFGAATGTDVCQDGGVLSACSSSQVWKQNISNLTISNGLWNKYLQINPVTFNYINKSQNKIGLIAEEVYELFPRFVYNTSLPIFTHVNLTREVEFYNETIDDVHNITEEYVYKNHSSDYITPSIDYDDIAAANILFIQDIKQGTEIHGAFNITGGDEIGDGLICRQYDEYGCAFASNSTCRTFYSPDGLSSHSICN